jgi:hypothetical protein
MTINDPEVVAELQALYPRHEEALVTNDVDTLVAMFWSGREVMRFGITENLYGPGELSAFRKGRAAVNLARTVKGSTSLVLVGISPASLWSLSGMPPLELSAAVRARCGSGFPRAGGSFPPTSLCCRRSDRAAIPRNRQAIRSESPPAFPLLPPQTPPPTRTMKQKFFP